MNKPNITYVNTPTSSITKRARSYLSAAILFILSLGVFSTTSAQTIPSGCILLYEAAYTSVDSSLLQSIKKTLANDTLALAYYTALSYYPELSDVKIRLKYKRIKTSMTSRPTTLSTLFRKPAKRTYVIRINSSKKSSAGKIANMAPFNAQVGLFGHELAHVVDYSQQSSWQLAKMGISYLSKKKRKKIEHYTDSLTITHGLGWQVYHYCHFVLNDADIDSKYRQYKQQIYMSENDILELIQNP